MTIVLYRRRLSLTSGAGQLIRMQAEGLQAAGESVRAVCRRGSLEFRLKTGLPVKRLSNHALGSLAASSDRFFVDHQMAIPEADLVFVHNLMSEAVRHVPRDDWVRQASLEAAFFRTLRPEAPIVANSELVKQALLRHFELDPARIVVHYPGFSSDRFVPHDRAAPAADGGTAEGPHPKRAPGVAQSRLEARRSLGIDSGVPLIGFVTSGELDKRGLDIFLACAEGVSAVRPDARFLVAGVKRLPEAARRHPLVRNGHLSYRPKSSRPERWFAALDVFLYPARFEEFGMVVSEAQASRLPVLTSRRVGAAECLPEAYQPWLIDEPDAPAFAEKTLALLADEQVRLELASAGLASVTAFGRERYIRDTVTLIRECVRAKGAGASIKSGS